MRHNTLLGDLIAELYNQVCKDVVGYREPRFIPLDNEEVKRNATGDQAALGISSWGLWSPLEKTF